MCLNIYISHLTTSQNQRHIKIYTINIIIIIINIIIILYLLSAQSVNLKLGWKGLVSKGLAEDPHTVTNSGIWTYKLCKASQPLEPIGWPAPQRSISRSTSRREDKVIEVKHINMWWGLHRKKKQDEITNLSVSFTLWSSSNQLVNKTVLRISVGFRRFSMNNYEIVRTKETQSFSSGLDFKPRRMWINFENLQSPAYTNILLKHTEPP